MSAIEMVDLTKSPPRKKQRAGLSLFVEVNSESRFQELKERGYLGMEHALATCGKNLESRANMHVHY